MTQKGKVRKDQHSVITYFSKSQNLKSILNSKVVMSIDELIGEYNRPLLELAKDIYYADPSIKKKLIINDPSNPILRYQLKVSDNDEKGIDITFFSDGKDSRFTLFIKPETLIGMKKKVGEYVRRKGYFENHRIRIDFPYNNLFQRLLSPWRIKNIILEAFHYDYR